MQNKIKALSLSLILFFIFTKTSSANMPSYDNETKTISSSIETNQGQQFISAINGSEINISSDLNFENQILDNNTKKEGGLFYIESSKLSVGDNISFSNNSITVFEASDDGFSNNTAIKGGIFFLNNSYGATYPLDVKFGNNIKFDNNEISSYYKYTGDDFFMNHAEVYGGIIATINYPQSSKISFGNDISFSNNIISSTLITNGIMGMGSSMVYGGIFWNGVDTDFGNNIAFDNNQISSFSDIDWSSNIQGGIIHNQGKMKFGDNVSFSNNTISTNGGIYGGIISGSDFTFGNNLTVENNIINAGENTIGAVFSLNGDVTFNGSTNFVNNQTTISYGDANVGTISFYDGTMNFSSTKEGQNILIENNSINGKLNSFILYANDRNKFVNLNFNMIKGTTADIRDPMANKYNDYSIVNKNGEGKFLLWGDNSEYLGKMNINSGDFYLMFDENDANFEQRHNANLNNATVTFGNNTVYRPRVSATQLASLNSATTTVGTGVTLLPYDLSSLNVGNHTYNNDYSKFEGWDSVLANVNTSSTDKTNITIKRDLEGYEGLSALADSYRKQNNLNYAQRDELDYLYMTGIVSQDILDKFKVIGGQDVVNTEETHRTSIRQFNRQIVSRIQNKNCSDCGVKEGYKDEHLWFNMGQNFIDKETNEKSLGYTYNPTSIAIGYDNDFIPQKLNLGIAFGYATGEAKTSSGDVRSTNDINEYLLSLYGKYKPSKLYISGSIGGGLMTNDTNFASHTGNATSQYDTKVLFANGEIGYDVGRGNLVVEPYLGAEYTKVMTDSHTEKGTGARHFGAMDWDVFETPLGLRIAKDIYSKNYIFTPMIDVAYAHNFGDKGSSNKAYFVGNAGDSWKVLGSSEKRDSMRGNLNFKINNLTLPFSVNVGYGADYRTDYTDQQVYGTFRYDF